MSRLQQLKEMLEKEPEDSFLNYALALEYAKNKETDRAISIISDILKKDSDYLGAYYQLGKLYEQTSDIEKAQATYEKGITIARQQKNSKMLAELKEALGMLDEDQ